MLRLNAETMKQEFGYLAADEAGASMGHDPVAIDAHPKQVNRIWIFR